MDEKEFILKTRDIHKTYGKFTALNGLTMEVPKGAVYGLVGRNGAGKTTLIRLICGLAYPTKGEYELCGVANSDKSIYMARRRLGAIVETPAIYPDMTARENIEIQSEIIGDVKEKMGTDELLKLVGLDNTGKKKAGKFSLGMRQRLAIAIALCGNPEFLVLDEPINGLDPEGIIEVRELILKLNQEKGITILISSHILDELSKVATHYGFVDKGKIIRQMSAKQLENECRKSYLITTDKAGAGSVLENLGYECETVDEKNTRIYDNVDITGLVLKLHDAGINVEDIAKEETNLERFFLDIVGDGGDEKTI